MQTQIAKGGEEKRNDNPKGLGYADYIKKKQGIYDKATKPQPDSEFQKVRKGIGRKLRKGSM
jgi:hypothetical protein